jgi:hypothetical protein
VVIQSFGPLNSTVQFLSELPALCNDPIGQFEQIALEFIIMRSLVGRWERGGLSATGVYGTEP